MRWGSFFKICLGSMLMIIDDILYACLIFFNLTGCDS